MAVHGQLHVCGVNLCNQNNKAIQLRGMSTHGLQWFSACVNTTSVAALAHDWKADCCGSPCTCRSRATRPTRPVHQPGDTYVDLAERRGLYAIIDFHTLTPGDPNYNLDRAKTFFAAVAARNANKKNVIYEIANEPNGVAWQQIKTYARAGHPGHPGRRPRRGRDRRHPRLVVAGRVRRRRRERDPVDPVNATNIMYAFHFYAASHTDNYRSVVSRAAGRLPLFVTEFGTASASPAAATST